MSKRIQAIRGMNDISPTMTPYWQHIETVLRQISANYGYSEIRFPEVESTALFERTIGQATDIVEKEMYTFEDRNGDSLTLRPEGTAGCVRAAIELGLLHNQIQRLWYIGPMFRHEKPQKGRYRQFYQYGIEAFGMAGPDIDAEIILLSARIWQQLGIENKVVLQLNSLGTSATRAQYRQELVNYFNQHVNELDEDSRRRLQLNPLRILDSKNPQLQLLIKNAPQMVDYLDEESKQHFAQLQQLLQACGVHYQLNPRLVRGLDYYNHTVFEWVTNELGAQGTVCAGGRYDGLVEQLGGQTSPAVGFALGIDRIISLIENVYQPDIKPDAYLVLVGENTDKIGLKIAEQLRSALPSLKLIVNCGGGSFKNQFKRADKSGARFALIIGEDELASDTIALKDLRSEQSQQTMKLDELIALLQK